MSGYVKQHLPIMLVNHLSMEADASKALTKGLTALLSACACAAQILVSQPAPCLSTLLSFTHFIHSNPPCWIFSLDLFIGRPVLSVLSATGVVLLLAPFCLDAGSACCYSLRGGLLIQQAWTLYMDAVSTTRHSRPSTLLVLSPRPMPCLYSKSSPSPCQLPCIEHGSPVAQCC